MYKRLRRNMKSLFRKITLMVTHKANLVRKLWLDIWKIFWWKYFAIWDLNVHPWFYCVQYLWWKSFETFIIFRNYICHTIYKQIPHFLRKTLSHGRKKFSRNLITPNGEENSFVNQLTKAFEAEKEFSAKNYKAINWI